MDNGWVKQQTILPEDSTHFVLEFLITSESNFGLEVELDDLSLTYDCGKSKTPPPPFPQPLFLLSLIHVFPHRPVRILLAGRGGGHVNC